MIADQSLPKDAIHTCPIVSSACQVIGEKFHNYTDNRDTGRRWVSVKGKVPVIPGTTTPLEWRKLENRYTWENVQKIPGDYGIILDKTGLACLDFDKCLENGEITPDRQYIQEILKRFDTFCEISTSGNGLHVWIVTDANTKNVKKLGIFELITDGHVKVTGIPYPPYADRQIQMWDRDGVEGILVGNIPTEKKKTTTSKAGNRIQENTRNETLFKTAASLRARGLTEPAILAALKAENQERCDPPLPDAEIETIAGSASKYPLGNTTPLITDQEGRGEELVRGGNFIDLLEKQFQRIWCGDGHILLWIVHAFAAGFVTNNDEGLHLSIAGASGLGKSESVKHALTLIPGAYVISGGFSRKGLIYLAEKMNACSIVLMDDHCYDEDEAGIYRAMLAGWREPTNYYTVDRASKTVQLKERITQIVTNADGLAEVSSDGQNESRFCTIEIRRSDDQMKEIMDFIRAEQKVVSKDDMDLITSAWAFIINNPKHIEIPYSGDIVIDDSAVYKIREFKKFLCLIRASALLHGRTTATQDDYGRATKMWTYLLLMLDNETAGLAKNEKAVFEKISELSRGGKRVRLSDLKDALPTMKEPNIYRAIRGRDGSFSNTSGGLLSKIRGLSIEKIYMTETGESDQIIKLNNIVQSLGRSPYSLELFS